MADPNMSPLAALMQQMGQQQQPSAPSDIQRPVVPGARRPPGAPLMPRGRQPMAQYPMHVVPNLGAGLT